MNDEKKKMYTRNEENQSNASKLLLKNEKCDLGFESMKILMQIWRKWKRLIENYSSQRIRDENTL